MGGNKVSLLSWSEGIDPALQLPCFHVAMLREMPRDAAFQVNKRKEENRVFPVSQASPAMAIFGRFGPESPGRQGKF